VGLPGFPAVGAALESIANTLADGVVEENEFERDDPKVGSRNPGMRVGQSNHFFRFLFSVLSDEHHHRPF